jgi:hypothetical protein
MLCIPLAKKECAMAKDITTPIDGLLGLLCGAKTINLLCD